MLAVPLLLQLSESEVRAIMLQLLTAVQYLHRNGVWHRDIKSANILMTYTNGVRCAAAAEYLVQRTWKERLPAVLVVAQ